MLHSEWEHSADHAAWKSSGAALSQQQELRVASWLPSSSRDACSALEGASGKRLFVVAMKLLMMRQRILNGESL